MRVAKCQRISADVLLWPNGMSCVTLALDKVLGWSFASFGTHSGTVQQVRRGQPRVENTADKVTRA